MTGPDLGLADALATAVAVAGEPGLALIAELDGYEALIIDPDGATRWTERLPLARRGAYPATGSLPPAPEAAGSGDAALELEVWAPPAPASAAATRPARRAAT